MYREQLGDDQFEGLCTRFHVLLLAVLWVARDWTVQKKD